MNRTKSILSAPQSTMTPMALIVATLLTCLTACSSDNDSPEEPELQTSISFGASLPEATNVESGTRAEGLETKNTEFTVWAYKNKALISGDGTPASPYNYGNLQTVMSQYKVQWAENTANTTLTNTHDWDYIGIDDQTIKYWDFDAKAYRFFGATPSSAIGSALSVAKTDEKVTFAITADATSETTIAATPYFSRLWFSNNNINSSNKYADVVQLEFIKPFARVRVMFTFAEGLEIPHATLSNISFKPADDTKQIPQSGTVTVTYPLTGTETAETITTEPSTSNTLAAITQDYWVGDADDPAHLTWYTVFPIASQGVYQMTLNVEGVEKTAYVPAEFMSWDANYSYTYIFKILEGGGVIFDEVQVGIKGWNNAETFNHPVYNW